MVLRSYYSRARFCYLWFGSAVRRNARSGSDGAGGGRAARRREWFCEVTTRGHDSVICGLARPSGATRAHRRTTQRAEVSAARRRDPDALDRSVDADAAKADRDRGDTDDLSQLSVSPSDLVSQSEIHAETRAVWRGRDHQPPRALLSRVRHRVRCDLPGPAPGAR